MEGLIELLKRWNLWEKEINIGIRREKYIKQIMLYMERKEVLVLKGIRRSGKSTIMKQLMHELIQRGASKKEILYVNLEDYGFANNLTIQLFDNILSAYLEYSKNKKKIYFFIDEIQKIPDWEKWIRTKYDIGEDIKFIISGSSASLLSKELSTLLTGRNLSFRILPLSYNEFIYFTKNTDIEKYMAYGGFPEVVLEKSVEKKVYLLQQYFEDIIHKDIIGRYAIRNSKQMIDLARYLVSASGSKTSINKLSKIFGIAKETLQTYINYMIDAYLLFEVTYFSYSAKVRHDVTKLAKLYCMDMGLINIVNTSYSKNIGQKYENAVCMKLAEIYTEISYWGTLDSEVDFIAGKTAVNVTASDKIAEREIKGLQKFNREHKEFTSMIISKSLKKDNIIPLREFLRQENILQNT